MASLTTNLQLINLAFGDSAYGGFGDWGAVSDENFRILEKALTEVTSKSVTSSDVNLSDEEELASIISLSGALTGDRAVTVSGRKKTWIVRNACTGEFHLTFKTDAGTGFVVPQGGFAICYSDGTNIIPVYRSPMSISKLASGSAVDFRIPSDTSRITILFNNLSCAAVAPVFVGIGDSGGLETSGYNAVYNRHYASSSPEVGLANTLSGDDAFYVATLQNGTVTVDGQMVLTDIFSGLVWICDASIQQKTAAAFFKSSGNKTLSGVLTQLSVFVGGSTFDAGSIVVICEFI